MRVLARIELLASDEGGRSDPLIGSFRPHHRFNGALFFCVGQVEQAPEQLFMPGDTAERIIDFCDEGVPEMTPGLRWEVFDGPSRLMGHCTILEIIGD